MQFLRLAWLLLPILQAEGQLLSSPDGVCKEGWECRKERHCPQYLDQKDRLKRLEGAWAWGGGGGHKKKLADELAELVCNIVSQKARDVARKTDIGNFQRLYGRARVAGSGRVII